MNKIEIRSFIKQKMKTSPCDSNPSIILSNEQFIKADIVLGFLPLKGEADCSSVIKWAMDNNKIVAIPKVKSESSQMDFFILKNDLPLENQVEKGAFGILEPCSNLELLKIEKNHLAKKKIFVIVPGLAFTKDGKRCGRGKGFYDFFIERLKANCGDVFLCGFCNSWQILDDIEMFDHDKKMDLVVCN